MRLCVKYRIISNFFLKFVVKKAFIFQAIQDETQYLSTVFCRQKTP